MITPVLLCGGDGTRLWPLSRKSYPKQFAPLIGECSLFQASATRLSGDQFSPPLVQTHADFRFIVREQLAEVGVDPAAILIEPDGRNTAPAILAAALWLEKRDPEGLMLVTPADHAVPDGDRFKAAVEAGVPAAKDGRLVTFGIRPTRTETGFGYLEMAQPLTQDAPTTIPVKRFVEKPDADRAQAMIAADRVLWNAGIFLFSVRAILSAYRDQAANMVAQVAAAVERAKSDLDFIRLDPDSWQAVDRISIDYAIMERADNLSVVPYPGAWADLGGWDAVLREAAQDENGVAQSGAVTALDCENTLLRSEDANLQLVGLGLRDVIAVAMPDAVLVADANRAQDVKAAVETLRRNGVKQATEFPKDHRPWGWFESLVVGDRFQVKRIHVLPGAALSLQSHHHRAEHWIVVAGTARVTIGDEVKLVSENQSVYVPLGEVHRLENPGKLPMTLIEVQTGSYLGEDDIIRYEDVYARD